MSYSDFRRSRRPVSCGVCLYFLAAEPRFLVQLQNGLWTDGAFVGPMDVAERWLYERACLEAEFPGADVARAVLQ